MSERASFLAVLCMSEREMSERGRHSSCFMYEWEGVILTYEWGLFMIFMLFLYRLCCKAVKSMRFDLFSVRLVFSVKPSPLQGRPFCFRITEVSGNGKNNKLL